MGMTNRTAASRKEEIIEAAGAVLFFVAYVFGIGASFAYLSASCFACVSQETAGEVGTQQAIAALVWPLWLLFRLAGWLGRAFV